MVQHQMLPLVRAVDSYLFYFIINVTLWRSICAIGCVMSRDMGLNVSLIRASYGSLGEVGDALCAALQ